MHHAYDDFEGGSSGRGCGCCGGCMSTVVSLLIALVGGLIVLFTSFGPQLVRTLGPMLDRPDPVEQAPAPTPAPKKGKDKDKKRRKGR